MDLKTIAVLCGTVISGSVYAGCPSTLSAEKLTECITIEGAGANYQDWSKKFNKSVADAKPENTVSEITGEDIRTVKPAAGK